MRFDVAAGRGMGAVSAWLAAADAGARLWEEDGLWASGAARRLYRARSLWTALAFAAALAGLALALPAAAAAAAVALYPVVFAVHLVAPAAGADITATYRDLLSVLLSPVVLSSLVPRMAAVGLLAAALALLGAAAAALLRHRDRRQVRGGLWWRALGAPIDSTGAVRWATGGFWHFIRGAAHVAEPSAAELSRRYCELVSDSLGQPGYRELVITAHDVDARRDLVFALLAEPFRTSFAAPDQEHAHEGRLSELIDLGGAGADHAVDALAGALSVPGLCEPHRTTFAPESHWRGETHRLCDRPDVVVRLFEEVAAAGATQVIVVSAVATVDGPHALTPARLGLRPRAGELLASVEAAALEAAVGAASHRFWGIYRIRPAHNPLGPFDLRGGYDDRSDRVFSLRELTHRGYEDAYRQFIEPIVGASGETIRTATPTKTPDPDDLPLHGPGGGLDRPRALNLGL